MNKHNLNINTLSPVHIGNGNKLTSVGEYISTSHTVRIIDQEHLLPLLKSKKLYDNYIAYILNYAQHTHVWDFFTENNICDEIRYTQEMKLNAEAFNPESNNILETAIETRGQKYIPGSSLKGAIRTIIFADFIANDQELKSKIEKIVATGKNLSDIRKKIETVEDDYLNDVFHQFRVEDSALVNREDIVVEIAKRVHLFGVDTKGLDNLRECIDKDVSINSVISIDAGNVKNEFRYLKEDDLAGLFLVINQVMEAYIAHEINLLKPSVNAVAKEIIKSLTEIKAQIVSAKGQSATLRLGKGKSFIYQVILPFLSSISQQTIMQLLVDDEEKRRNYPKTRVLTDSNQMLGWVRLCMLESPVTEINYFDNKVENPKQDITKLKAYFLETKKVSFMYNGTVYPSLQLINPFKKTFKKRQEIEVILHQMSKEGKITQVKLD